MATEELSRAFEMAMAAVQAAIDPSATVEQNVVLQDRQGMRRQFDVVVRTEAAGHNILGVIECKHHGRPVGRKVIDAFKTASEAVHANVRLVVSASGFTKQARELANAEGIGLLSPVAPDWLKGGVTIGVRVYAEIYLWSHVRMVLVLANGQEYACQEPDTVTYRGWRIADYFHKTLVTSGSKERNCGWHTTTLTLNKPRYFRSDGARLHVRAIKFWARRDKRVKSKWVNMRGTAFYDWNRQKLVIPKEVTFHFDPMRFDLVGWDDATDAAPLEVSVWKFTFTHFVCHTDPNAPAFDLREL